MNFIFKNYRNIFLYILVLIFTFGLIVYSYNGTFVRYMADDFCVKASLSNVGFFKTFSAWFMFRTGKFSFIFLNLLTISLGEKFFKYLPTIYLLIWLIATFWLTWEITKRFVKPNMLSIFLISELIIFVVLRLVPNLYQSLYWPSAGIYHVFPIILLTFLCAYTLRLSRQKKKINFKQLIIIFLSSIFIGGLAEITTAISLVLLLVALFFVLKSKNSKIQKLLPYLLVSLIAFLIAAFSVAFGPGNQARYNFYSHNSFWQVFPKSAFYFIYYFIEAFLRNWTGWLATFAFAVFFGINYFLGHLDTKKYIYFIVLSLSIMFVITYTTIFVYYLATGQGPLERVLFYPDFFIIISLVVIGCLTGIFIRQAGIVSSKIYSNIFLVGFIIFALFIKTGPLITTINYIRGQDTSKFHLDRNNFIAFTKEWDQRNINLKNASGNVVSYPISNIYGIDDLTSDPDFFVNKCMSNYFKLDSIIIKSY